MFDSDYKKLTIILNAERILYRGGGKKCKFEMELFKKYYTYLFWSILIYIND